jgi:hypothetical protein
MRKQIAKIFIQVAILNLFCSLTGLLTVQAAHDRTTLSKAQTHAVLVENASPTW